MSYLLKFDYSCHGVVFHQKVQGWQGINLHFPLPAQVYLVC